MSNGYSQYNEIETTLKIRYLPSSAVRRILNWGRGGGARGTHGECVCALYIIHNTREIY